MVVDTSIFIEHLRAKDKSQTELSNLPRVTALFVSAITVYELHSGAPDEKRQREIDRVLEGYIMLPVNREVAIQAGKIYLDLRQRALLIGIGDILIAATASSKTCR